MVPQSRAPILCPNPVPPNHPGTLANGAQAMAAAARSRRLQRAARRRGAGGWRIVAGADAGRRWPGTARGSGDGWVRGRRGSGARRRRLRPEHGNPDYFVCSPTTACFPVAADVLIIQKVSISREVWMSHFCCCPLST
jgi:hypothetical protein